MSTNTTEFRLRNIEEFDADFVRNVRVIKQQPPVKPQEKTVPSLIPELDKTVFSVKSATQTPPQNNETQNEFNRPADIPITGQPPKAPPRPLVPIGSGQTVIPPAQERIGGAIPVQPGALNLNEIDIQDEKEEKAASKSKAAPLTLKIFSILFLSLTVITFLLGCLVAIFLNNNGTQLAGYCFNSQIRDLTFETDDGEITINEGSLIISKPLSSDEYETNMLVSVLTTNDLGEKFCDVYSVGTVTEINADVSELELIVPDTGISAGQTTSADCYGLIEYYIPVIGGMLAFTLSSALNAILVCALFILIAAFWSLLLILSEKKLKELKDNQ